MLEGVRDGLQKVIEDMARAASLGRDQRQRRIEIQALRRDGVAER